MQKSDLLWSLYVSEREFIQHHENQRTSASNILTAIAAGLIVALGTEQLNEIIEVSICIVLMALGLFGFAFCGKLSALIKLHAQRSYEYLRVLDEEITELDIKTLKNRANKSHSDEHQKFSKVRLSSIWSSFHLFVFVSGIVFFVVYSSRAILKFL